MRNNTYKAVRVVAEDYNLYYSVWCNNEHELYDLNVSPEHTFRVDLAVESISLPNQTDPYQLHNIHPSVNVDDRGSSFNHSITILDYPVAKIVSRLDALLLVLKSCKGPSCIEPWHVLHPTGDVANLKNALDAKFDEYYEEAQVKVEFSRCEQGQLLDAEGPQRALVYRDGLNWSEWT